MTLPSRRPHRPARPGLDLLEGRLLLSVPGTYGTATNGEPLVLRSFPGHTGEASNGEAVELRDPPTPGSDTGSSGGEGSESDPGVPVDGGTSTGEPEVVEDDLPFDWSGGIETTAGPTTTALPPGLLGRLLAGGGVQSLPTAGGAGTVGGLAALPRGFVVTRSTAGQSSLVRIGRGGSPQTLFRAPAGQTLTAVVPLRSGFLVVATRPDAGGPGALQILDRSGRTVGTIQDAGLINAATALVVQEQGRQASVFVANAGNGTISRLNLEARDGRVQLQGGRVIATGYAAGSLALAYDARRNTLFVGSGTTATVYAVDQAAGRRVAAGPGRALVNGAGTLGTIAGLAVQPAGHLLVSGNSPSGQSSRLAEYTAQGQLVTAVTVARTPNAASSLALRSVGAQLSLATTNATTGTVQLRALPGTLRLRAVRLATR